MVESVQRLDLVFSSLADATRRDILSKVAKGELSVGEIAEHYDSSLAAISKHLQILEKANLIKKRREGKQQIVYLEKNAFKDVDHYLTKYKKLWNERLDRLEQFLAEEKHGK